MSSTPPASRRRDLFTGLAARPDEAPAVLPPPCGGSTVRLTARCMACDFSVIMNPGSSDRIAPCSEALEQVSAIESWMSLYRPDSELSRVNELAATRPVRVRPEFVRLVLLAMDLYHRTTGGFDMSLGTLTRLWKRCRREERLPEPMEVEKALELCGMQKIRLEPASESVEFLRPGVVLDPGAIGKGFALDQAATRLVSAEKGPDAFLLHGGHSSLIAQGRHNDLDGWPVGLGNPLFTERRLATVLMKNQAMGTSGSNIQFFRHGGRRYGHILDPKTGWPVEGMLSVTVLAGSAAVADALSTAFFAMGIEKTLECLGNWPEIGTILIPFPERGRKVCPVVRGIPPDQIFWDEDQADVS